jgi:hypothetical protein
MASKVTCSNCGWSWNKSDSSNKDMYVCHQCGRDNSNKSESWLDKYEQGGMVLKQKTEDNYFKKPNPNEAEVSMPPGYVGMGNNTKGRNYSPAWGGQFKDGGRTNSSTPIIDDAGNYNEKGDWIPDWKNMTAQAKKLKAKKVRTKHGSLIIFNDNWEVVGVDDNPDAMRTGGSLPGSVGFTYARTAGSAPANGKYTKKTLASAQNGQEMSYYQHGLDFKTKGMKNGGWLDKYETPQAQEGDVFPKREPLRPARESVSIMRNIPGEGSSTTATTGQRKGDVRLDTEGMARFKTAETKDKQKRVAERKSAIAAKDKGKPFTLPTGESKKYEDMDWREKAYVSGKSLESKGRANEDDEAWYDEINPVNWLTSSAGGLATAPYEARESNSNMPYVGAVLNPLVQGALGFDPLGAAMKVPGRVAQSMESGVLSNAYKLNPYAFKPNEANWYRQVGKSGIDDALESGLVREAGEEVSPRMWEEFQEQLVRMQGNGMEAILAGRRPTSPFFAKGELFYPMGRKPTINKLTGKISKNPAGKGSADYLIETALPNESFQPAYVKGMGLGVPEEVGSTAILKPNPSLREAENFNFYKKDWLKGYKEVPKSFKSEIDWNKWNSEIPSNQELINEYRTIEQASKANNTWMKNPNGSAFKGTPEQFVQQNSQNFKKAFGNTKVRDLEGNIQIANHGTFNKFDEFDLNEFGKTDSGFYGKGVYFHPNTNSRGQYGNIDMNSYVNIENPMPHSEPSRLFGREGRGGYFDQKTGDRIEVDDVSSLWKNKYDGYITNHSSPRQFNDREYITNIPSNIKSATGNNGMFDMTNPNIYKALVPAAIGVGALEQKKEGGVVKDNDGYWNPDNHGKVVEIGSPYITMEGVDQPLLGISDEGDQQYMTPGNNYKFKGTKVREYPMAKNGKRQEQKGLINLDDLLNFTNYNIPKAQNGDFFGKGKLQTRSGEQMTFAQANQILKKSLAPMIAEKAEYINSPLYKKRLVGMGEKDPNQVVKDRLQELKKIEFSSYDPRMNAKVKESEPSRTKKMFRSDKEGKTIGDYPAISLGVGWTPSSAAHELGHVTSSQTDRYVPTPTTGTGETMSPTEAKEFLNLSRLKPEFKKEALALYDKNVRTNISNPYGAIYDTDLGSSYATMKGIDEHSIGSGEAKGDLDAVRYLLKKQGITKKYGEDITPETLKKAQQNKNIQNDEFFKRLKKRFSDEDIIKLNNTIAQNNSSQELTYAKLGTKLKTKGWLEKYN